MKYHDLCMDEVKLDYDALLKTAEIAYVLSRERVSCYLSELRQNDEKQENTGRYMTAERLSQAAQNLSVAAETYSALVEGKTRDIKTLVLDR